MYEWPGQRGFLPGFLHAPPWALVGPVENRESAVPSVISTKALVTNLPVSGTQLPLTTFEVTTYETVGDETRVGRKTKWVRFAG
jgi:hypothetical protein